MTILNNILAVSVREFRVMCTRYSILMVLSGGIFFIWFAIQLYVCSQCGT